MQPELAHFADLIRSGPHGLFSRGDLARIDEHVQDGVSGAELLRALGATTVVDIGSGGGVPGVPLAIELEGVEVHLVESQGWKCEFLLTCARALDLESSLKVHVARAEEALEAVGGRESIDVGTARAVARPLIVAEYLSPLVRVGGHLVLWTTQTHVDEIDPAALADASAKLGLGAPQVHQADTPLRDHAVHLVWPKVAPCDPRYPRRPGMATKRPLG